MNKNFRKTASIFLSIVLVLMMSLTAFAADFEGKGTKAEPYVISTAAQLDTLSARVAAGEDFSGKYFVLSSDITVSGSFAPIGNKDNAFSGNFNGNGKTVSGLNVQSDYAGLFGNCKDAAIASVTVKGTLFATDYAGAIVAYAENTVIEDCVCSAGVYADNFIGGIAGYIKSGKIVNCETTQATVGGYVDSCGGIAGFSGADIEGCKNNSFVYGEKNVGGIVGYSTGDIASCSNLVLVSSSGANVGGIAGLSEGDIKYCENKADVEAQGAGKGKAGGIAGVCSGSVISECVSYGNVSSTGNYAGGIAAYLTDGSIENCVAVGNVSTSANYAGGIFGYALRTAVSRCVFAASVTASSADAAIGAVASGTVDKCYYNSDKEAKAVATGKATNTVGVSTEAFKSSEAFTYLDFDKIWENGGRHGDYPLLQNVSCHTLNISEQSEVSCTKDGVLKGVCIECNKSVTKITPAYGHSFKVVSAKDATCTAGGFVDKICTVCSFAQTDDIAAAGHKDADADSVCDVCNADLSEKKDDEEKTIFQKIADFFKSIFQWIKNLFS